MTTMESEIIRDDERPIHAIFRMAKDLRAAASTMGPREARFLVDTYYQMQDSRKTAKNQVRSVSDTGEPHACMVWFSEAWRTIESNIKSALLVYAESTPIGTWAMSNVGIGPVIASGLMAHVDVSRITYISQAWTYAGLVPGREWLGAEKASALVKKMVERCEEAGQEPTVGVLAHMCAVEARRTPDRVLQSARRFAEGGEPKRSDLVKAMSMCPWNQRLKVILWHAGQCFMKFQNNDGCFYGHMYRAKKDELVAKNLAGGFAENARAALGAKRYGETTKAKAKYDSGVLPDAHVDAMARRYVAKMFLSHYVEVAMRLAGRECPMPWVIEHGGHKDVISPPNLDVVGLA